MAIQSAIILDGLDSTAQVLQVLVHKDFYKNKFKVVMQPKIRKSINSLEQNFLVTTNTCAHSTLLSLQIKCLSCSSISADTGYSLNDVETN
jgi:hypothetical protein